MRQEGRKARIFPFRERGLDSAAGIAQDADLAPEAFGKAFRGAGQVEFDDFGRTGTHQEQKLDIGPAL